MGDHITVALKRVSLDSFSIKMLHKISTQVCDKSSKGIS